MAFIVYACASFSIQVTERFFCNAEDEVFEQAAELSFSFVMPTVDGDDSSGTKHIRTVMLLPAPKLDAIIEEISRVLPVDDEQVQWI